MLEKDWLNLKSGSDIRGVAVEGVESPVDLTDETVSAIVKAYYVWLVNRVEAEPLTIAVGHDSRISAPRLSACVLRALQESGAAALDTGLSSTPAMFMITADEEVSADASVQITASHHPFDKNGLKFFTRDGGLEGKDVSEILRLAFAGASVVTERRIPVIQLDYMSRYAAQLVRFVREKTGKAQPLAGLKILVDAGNGAGGFYAEQVLKPLGADTSGSQFLEPDGMFPNHIPNPENPAAMQSVCEAVTAHHADFGVIFDTDVDRAGCVDGNGKEINRSRLIALISAILLEETPGSTIVTDSVTSDGLHKFITERGGVHHRFKRGYKNVIDECVRLNREGVDSPLAIETSGHAAFRENYYLDDGAYLVTRILISLANANAAGRNLLSLVESLEMPAEELEIRLGFHTPEFKAYGEGVIEHLKHVAEVSPDMSLADSNYEGVRVNLADGWFLVRMSVHDPIMPINIESRVCGGAKRIAAALFEQIRNFDGLNLDNLNKNLTL